MEELVLRDVSLYNAKTYLSSNFITPSAYSNINKQLSNYDQVQHTQTSAPTIDINAINMLANSGLLVATFIVNQLSKGIQVVQRNNVRQTFIPERHGFKDQLVIRNVYVINKHNGPELDKYFHQEDKSVDNEFNLIRDQYIEFKKHNNHDNMFVIIDAIVPSQALEENHSLYVANRDIVISIESLDIAPPHPFNTAESAKEWSEKMLNEQSGYGVLIDIVDSTGSCGNKYMHVGNIINTIVPRKNNAMADGIYVYKTWTNEYNKRRTNINTYLLNECDKAGLFNSYADAVAGSDKQTQREKELEDRKHENNTLKSQLENVRLHTESELQKLRLDAEREKAEYSKQEYAYKQHATMLNDRLMQMEHGMKRDQEKWDREKLDLQRSLEREKNHYGKESLQRSDHYEERSHIRKDTSEVFKFLPVLATAALGIWAYSTK